MKKYSIISYIFNNYENIREIEEKSKNCEYILITDNPNLKSKTWKIICNPKVLEKFNNPFDKCFYIRYHSFEFCNTDISITIDHSIKILKSLDKLILEFEKRNSNFGFVGDISTSNNSIRDCIKYFLKYRKYSDISANTQLAFLDKMNYNKHGGIEAFLIIRRKNLITKLLDETVWNTILKTGENGHVDRLDQTILTFYYFNLEDKDPLIFDRKIVYSSFLQWYKHKSNKIFPNNMGFIDEIWFNDKKIKPWRIE